MTDRWLRLGVEAGLLNYMDLETPRRYFIDGNADIEEVMGFAELIENSDELVVEATKAINQLRKENKALRFASYISKSALSTAKTQNMLMIDMLTDLVENWERLTDGDLSRIKDTLDEVLS